MSSFDHSYRNTTVMLLFLKSEYEDKMALINKIEKKKKWAVEFWL